MVNPDAALIERFRRDLEALTGERPDRAAPLGLAVSGGPDSLGLLLLAASAYPGAVKAATVDHGLRPEAAAEAALVGSLCDRLGVPHTNLTAGPNMTFGGNLQERARSARYLLLAQWGGSNTFLNRPPWRVTHIATAHQRDDVAEGFLMRARRGAGVGGLAAMSAMSRPMPTGGPPIVRPLLGWSRSELAAVVAEAGVQAATDPSNVHPRFDRSRMRRLLADEPDLPPARIALAAQNLRHAEDALDWLSTREWDARHVIEDYENVRLDVAGLPYEVRRRLARRAVDHVRFSLGALDGWRGAGLDRLVAALDRGEAGTLAHVAATLARDGRWRFSPAPPRRAR